MSIDVLLGEACDGHAELAEASLREGGVVGGFHRCRGGFELRGTIVMPRQIFIWPLREIYGDMAAVMAHFRLGGMYYWNGRLVFYLGQHRVVTVGDDGRVSIKRAWFETIGYREGSR